MEKLIVLGTGAANVVERYNTCFLLEDCEANLLLVDTGGGNRIYQQFKEAHVDLNNIHHIFLSHQHIDHLLGMLWIYRYVHISITKGTYEGNLTIYCHDELAKILREQIRVLFREEQQKFLDKRIFIREIHDHEKIKIFHYEFEFFDIFSKIDKQFGFKTVLNSGKTLSFLGDEPLDEKLYAFVRGSDYLLHEAFCLETEADQYKPREKNHETVLWASRKAQELEVKNLVLWHTLENLGSLRKEKYREEAKKNFMGKVYVPNDLEIIELN